MTRILLLVAFIGTTVAQLKFDPLGKPLFEVMLTAPNFSPPPPPDAHRINPIPASNSVSADSPQFSPPPQIPQQRPAGDEGRSPLPPPPQRPPVLATPLPPNLRQLPNRFRDIFNSRIRAEGFEFIERRFTVSRRKRSQVLAKAKRSFNQIVSSEFDGFLLFENNPVHTDAPEIDSSNNFEGSGVESEKMMEAVVSGEDINNDLSVLPSSTALHKEPGYKASVTKVNQKSRSKSKNSPKIDSILKEEAESNSIPDEEEGSAISENSRMMEDNGRKFTITKLSDDSLINPVQEEAVNEEVLEDDSLPIEEEPSNSDVDKSSVSSPPAVSSNKVSFLPNSKLLRIFKENIPLILGFILGIPAIVVLCYFMYLKRLKRYTGTLDVSPPRTVYNQMKSSHKAKCSEKNELACSPSTSASKTPQPPPFPTHCKKHIP